MTLPSRLDPASWRAAVWALRARRHCRRHRDVHGLAKDTMPPPPVLPDSARRAVRAALTRSRATCLERATVLQAWDLAHDRSRDVIIGVTKPSTGFHAHAWLDGDEAQHSEGFTELLRLPPPARPCRR